MWSAHERADESVGRAGRLGGVDVEVGLELSAAADHCSPFSVEHLVS